MHFITAFVALLAITPALCAPTPTPTGETVESLAASANGKPVELIKKLAPIAKEIADLVASMSAADTQGASTSVAKAAVPQPTPSQAASTKSTSPDSTAPNNPPAANADAKVQQSPVPLDQKAVVAEQDTTNSTAAAVPPQAQPETGNGSPPSEQPTPTSAASDSSSDEPASPAATESPADTPESGTIQRRAAPTSASAPAPSPTPASAPAPTLIRKDVLKLRQLLARATMYEQAVESVMLAQGQNIEDIPSDKTAGGMAWGLANGPIMAVLGFTGSNVVRKQPS